MNEAQASRPGAPRSDRLAVVYLSDGRRDDLTHASVAALAMAHPPGLDIHLVQAGYAADAPLSVAQLLASRGHRLERHTIGGRSTGGRGHISATALAKAEAIDLVAGDCRRLLYLDTDTLAIRPVSFDLLGPRRSAVAAAPDTSVSTGLDNPRFLENCRANGVPARYFNSGVLLIDAERWKADALSQRFEACLRAHAEHCPYNGGACGDLDQCALNMAVAGDWEALPIAFNTQKSVFQTPLWDAAALRHYTGPEKFLPIRAHRADALEQAVLARVAAACPDLGIRAPGSFLGLAYRLNALRRIRDRRRIAHTVAERLGALS